MYILETTYLDDQLGHMWTGAFPLSTRGNSQKGERKGRRKDFQINKKTYVTRIPGVEPGAVERTDTAGQ
jgi:hypothetical protein